MAIQKDLLLPSRTVCLLREAYFKRIHLPLNRSSHKEQDALAVRGQGTYPGLSVQVKGPCANNIEAKNREARVHCGVGTSAKGTACLWPCSRQEPSERGNGEGGGREEQEAQDNKKRLDR